MPKIKYKDHRFKPDGAKALAEANKIIEEYTKQGYQMTLRQLYYQLVARDLFPVERTWRQVNKKWVRDPSGTKNAEPNYKWLGDLINHGRMSGLVDWNAIVDLTRRSRSLTHYLSPGHHIAANIQHYNRDLWEDQDNWLEVWVEKDAVLGVIEQTCINNDVTHFACRGYTSASGLWAAAQRIEKQLKADHDVTILHLGDHDPSGLHMTQDIERRLREFMEHDLGQDHLSHLVEDHFRVERIALNLDQIESMDLVPNPAKETDARWQWYNKKTGLDEGWEMDVLDPVTMNGLIEEAILDLRDDDKWEAALDCEAAEREQLRMLSAQWDKVAKTLKPKKGKRK